MSDNAQTVPSYLDIPPITDFRDIFNHDFYYHPPESWYLVMTDVVNSTDAIAAGRYKEVNTAGSLGAMAISNITGDMKFPFLFGGDGMTYLIPAPLIGQVRDVLIDTRDLVGKVFSLELRVGIIPVAELKRRGGQLRIARFAVSERYTQAIIGGSGADLAERLIKDPDPANPWLIPRGETAPGTADFSGFTCRWQDVPSRSGETISFIVRARGASGAERMAVLSEVLEDISTIFGSEGDYHPLSRETQRQSRSQYYREARVLSGRTRGLAYALRVLGISLEVAALKLVEALRIPLKRGNKYFRDVKLDNIVNSDFRKYDGTLKMVISCSADQRQRFESRLEALHRGGRLNYGIHISDRALLTCLVQFGSGEEVHFIDAADGGYASAAVRLKAQIAADSAARS
jgi:hypothetical protein